MCHADIADIERESALCMAVRTAPPWHLWSIDTAGHRAPTPRARAARAAGGCCYCGGAMHGSGWQFAAWPDACWHFHPVVPWPVMPSRRMSVHACEPLPQIISPVGTFDFAEAHIVTFRTVMFCRLISRGAETAPPKRTRASSARRESARTTTYLL